MRGFLTAPLRGLHQGLQSVKRYRVTIDGRIYDVEIDDPNARPVTARLSGVAYSVDVEPERVGDTSPRRGSDTDGPGSGWEAAPRTAPVASAGSPLADGPRAMTAPIPGVVAAVMAIAGQTIKRGDELLTLDAPKKLSLQVTPRSRGRPARTRAYRRVCGGGAGGGVVGGRCRGGRPGRDRPGCR